jgi:tetratricopeptide (TPR) repeat protein
MREPIPPSKKKRLDALLEHAQVKISGDRPDHDYATNLLTQCVLGDPSNIFYVKAYIENLQKKYNNNKTGASLAKFKEIGARSAQKKALAAGDWDEVIKQGLQVLTVNPWDKIALMNMAIASRKVGQITRNPADFEIELHYLRTALIPSPKDPDINKLCGIALADLGELEQAITCWHRVEQTQPDNEEAKRYIASLNAQRMKRGERGSGDDGSGMMRPVGATGPIEEILSPEKKLLRKIAQQPDRMESYIELSQMYFNDERYADAEKILEKAYEHSKENVEIREKLEDAQLRHLRQKISLIEDPYEKKQLEKHYFAKELERCKNRCERYPANLLHRFELGYRYMLMKQYNEAIRELQAARNDPHKKGECLLALGQCFQQIKQYQLAMDHFEMAIEEIPDRDANNKKKSLYMAGRLALGLKNLELAGKHLSTLAAMDFAYKDVPALLDKLAKYRKNGPSDHPTPPEPEKPEGEG